MTRQWIISDTHLGHLKIQTFEPSRLAWGPDVPTMTNTLIDAWAAVVGPEDTVYHLGDFAMGLPDLMPGYRSRLPGSIILIRGNHDKRPDRWLTSRDRMEDVLEMNLPKLGLVIMRHDPHDFTLEEAARAAYLFHGHLHSNQHRGDTPEAIRHKARCFSIEVLPTRPAPMLLSEVR